MVKIEKFPIFFALKLKYLDFFLYLCKEVDIGEKQFKGQLNLYFMQSDQ